MTMIKRKMPDFDNLKNTGTATLDLPAGMTYHSIQFLLGGIALTRAMIKRVRVLINGKAFVRDIPATVLHNDNKYKGTKDIANMFLLDFQEPRSRTLADQFATSIGTAAGVNSFKVEFDIEGATDPVITTIANVTADERPLGLIPAFIKETYEAVSEGIKQVKFGYGKESAHTFKRVYFYPFNGALALLPSTVLGKNGVSLVKNGINVFDRVPDQMNRDFQEHYEGQPLEDAYIVDFVEDNNMTINLMPTGDANSLLWELDILASGGSVTPVRWDIYYSMVTTLDRL